MNRFTFAKLGRTLLLAAVVAVGAVCWAGCGGDDGGNDNPANNNGGNNNNNGNNNSGGTLGCGSRECKSAKMPDGKTWMTENLNRTTADSWCYGNSPDSCAKYGRLYTWTAAKAACPNGWKLPDTVDWNKLKAEAGGWLMAGAALKSTNGWNWNDNSDETGNGTDEFGFSALPGGYRNPDGSFRGVGSRSSWWTATAFEGGECRFGDCAFEQFMPHDGNETPELPAAQALGLSVRCIKN
jgi:uncharacterized protein (TIGR02145 family)